MRCRAWETKHDNGKTYIHVVEETLEVEVIKDLAERLAGSPCKMPILRDIAGSYLLADKGHESIGFSAFTPLDRSILRDVEDTRELLRLVMASMLAIAETVGIIAERLGVKEDK